MSSSTSNKLPRTSIAGWNGSPSQRSRRRDESHIGESPSAVSASGKRLPGPARVAPKPKEVTASISTSSNNTADADRSRLDAWSTLIPHEVPSMIVNASQHELAMMTASSSEASYMDMESAEALRRLAAAKEAHANAVADSQRNAKMDQVRAKAVRATDYSLVASSSTSVSTVNKPYRETEYQDQIMSYMVGMDNDALANPESMDSQPEVQWYMRPFLVDFLIEVHAQFRLRPEVLYLAMNIVDRYVSKRVVYKKHYQLVGCAALWTAAKFEDAKDKVPLTKELSEMCCKAYDESAFIQMEGHVLGTIGWNLGCPTAEAWLRMYTVEELEDKRTTNVARYIMEVSLFHRESVGVPAYDVAAGALILARYICGKSKRRDLGVGRAAVFGPESAERAVRVAYSLDAKFHHDAEPVSEVLRRKYTPSYYHSAAVFVKEWYSKPNNKYTNFVEPILSGRHFNFSSPSPSIGAAWRRASYMSSSPTASYSCSSSENGDEGPITPITPNNPHQATADPFSSHAAKENVNPTPTRVKAGPVPTSIRPMSTKSIPAQVADANMLYPQRQALLALPQSGGDMTATLRSQQMPRRLSN